MQKIGNPTPVFLSSRGTLLDGGKIYVGAANADPETSPVAVYFDAALTIPAAQPIRTLGGQIVNGAAPASIFIAQDDFSMRVRDAFDVQVSYSPSVYTTANATFQPLDADLSAIAALSTTAYGRNLLTLVNQAALKAATGIPDCLPLTGGTMTGGIARQGNGAYIYNANGDHLSGALYVTATGASDPTQNVGDLWIEVAS